MIRIAAGVRVFLNLEAGLTHESLRSEDRTQASALVRARQELASAREENRELRARLAATGGRAQAGIDPERIVWMFGTARTGSTWLSTMMGSMAGCRVWQEPLVGDLFGHLYYVRGAPHVERRGEDFILGRSHRESWLDSIRTFVLHEAAARFPGLTDSGYLIIKEPNGSIGAPLLMEALPESRMIFLLRDPRDVVASLLDANRRNGWLHGWEDSGRHRRKSLADPAADASPDSFVQNRARNLLRLIGKVEEAYYAHGGCKALVRYEDLRARTLQTMQRLYSGLEMDVDQAELARVVQKHAWENIPEERKGPGKSNRKATPGGWREDLTPGQVEIVERVTAPLLKEFYPDRAMDAGGQALT